MAESRLTAEGTHQGAFTTLDWGLLLGPAVIWGSSFFFIEIGLRAFEPMVITGLRVLFGFLALSFIPSARVPVDRRDLPRIALLGFTWMAFPLSMFSISEQWIASSVAGMLNAAMPLFTAIVATFLLRRAPGRNQMLGLGVGFVGVILISLPTIGDGSSSALGVGLVLAAIAFYAVSINLAIPIQQKYGSIPMFWRMQAFALVMLAPFSLASVPSSHFEWPSLLCCIALGALGTGLAFVLAGNLAGRVGASRASIITYLMPPLSILLGVAFLDETLAVLAAVGTPIVLVGAWLTSRADRAPRVAPIIDGELSVCEEPTTSKRR